VVHGPGSVPSSYPPLRHNLIETGPIWKDLTTLIGNGRRGSTQAGVYIFLSDPAKLSRTYLLDITAQIFSSHSDTLSYPLSTSVHLLVRSPQSLELAGVITGEDRVNIDIFYPHPYSSLAHDLDDPSPEARRSWAEPATFPWELAYLHTHPSYHITTSQHSSCHPSLFLLVQPWRTAAFPAAASPMSLKPPGVNCRNPTSPTMMKVSAPARPL
jgi:hypothetical protein